MTPSPALLDALEDLAAAWPRVEVSPRTIRVYARTLADFPDEITLAAINIAIRTCTFFPSIDELLGIIGRATDAGRIPPEDAWLEVQAEARRIGYNRLPEWRDGELQPRPLPHFSHPLIGQAVDVVGWRRICLADHKDNVGDAFMRAYKALQDRAIDDIKRGGAALPGGTSIPESVQDGQNRAVAARNGATPYQDPSPALARVLGASGAFNGKEHP